MWKRWQDQEHIVTTHDNVSKAVRNIFSLDYYPRVVKSLFSRSFIWCAEGWEAVQYWNSCSVRDVQKSNCWTDLSTNHCAIFNRVCRKNDTTGKHFWLKLNCVGEEKLWKTLTFIIYVKAARRNDTISISRLMELADKEGCSSSFIGWVDIWGTEHYGAFCQFYCLWFPVEKINQ